METTLIQAVAQTRPTFLRLHIGAIARASNLSESSVRHCLRGTYPVSAEVRRRVFEALGVTRMIGVTL